MNVCRHRRVEVGISKTFASCIECGAPVDMRIAPPGTEVVVDTLPIPRWRRAILLVLVVLEDLVAGEPDRAQERRAPTVEESPHAAVQPHVDTSERMFVDGQRALAAYVLGSIRDRLDEGSATLAALLSERIATVRALRLLCEQIGARNDWPNTLHLADVVEKYIGRHLETESSDERRK
jgi:hypothetical protein